MNEFIYFSSRKFKKSHKDRLKKLKRKLNRSGQDLLVDALEIGLTVLENPSRGEFKSASRIVPFGIKENGDA